MKLVKDYMNNDILRHKLNALTEKTYSFNFESWFMNGYYEGDYIPYSFEEDGKIVSNVSVNFMKFVQNGETKNYIQIGTVMTDKDYRKKGLARNLMEAVINDYEGKCDGIYLFGNLSALDFYRQLGFYEVNQYKYSLKENIIKGNAGFAKIASNNTELKKKYMDVARNSAIYGALDQSNKYALQMFYTAGLKNLYYSEHLECFIVIDKDDDTIELSSVISHKKIPLDKIISEINVEYLDFTLGFTPLKDDIHLFSCSLYDGGDDYRLFCLGSQLESIERDRLFFPTLSHA